MGFPSLILGGVAIWLGVWVKKSFSGNTASEVANLYAWAGIITGAIGVILGAVMTFIMVSGIGLGMLDAASR